MNVTLFSKGECGLCREAEEMLRRLGRRLSLELEIVDIEGDPALFERYRDRVPVVAVAGREIAAAPLDEELLRASLSASG
jgi:glutaredoxin